MAEAEDAAVPQTSDTKSGKKFSATEMAGRAKKLAQKREMILKAAQWCRDNEGKGAKAAKKSRKLVYSLECRTTKFTMSSSVETASSFEITTIRFSRMTSA